MSNERRAHWLRPNAAARLPRRVICFDCESYQERKNLRAEHTFRLACASFDKLDSAANPISKPETFAATSPDSLWDWIVSRTNRSHRTIAFAHNLSYDLRLSGALAQLPALGFQCKGIALTPYSCWARFHDGKRSLWLVDSLSFIPASLERIANALQTDKPPLPEDDANDDQWLRRCSADVGVTREAVLQLLRWLHTADLGDFRTTGSGQSMAAFRHRFLSPRTLLVHNDEAALAAERRAVWTGRAEVWRHGHIAKPIYEYDFASAYAHLARELELPCQLRLVHGPLHFDALMRVAEKYAVVADVEIETEVPCVPAAHEDHVVWPVGKFQTTLWDQELQLAHREGAKIEVLRYWQYKRAPILRSWAEWILDLLDGNEAGADPLLALTIKDWSRSLIGRFGLRYSEWDNFGTTVSSDVNLFGCYDADKKESTTMMRLGTEWFEQSQLVESPNSMPCVMGYIMSAARVRLWEAMTDAGFRNIYYIDTDGILVDSKGRENLKRAESHNRLPPLRHKDSFVSAVFRAPRNIDLGETRRVNGAPRRSERLSHSVYRGEVWESLPTALRHSRPDRVLVRDRTFHISDNDPRRTHRPDGSTIAIRLG